MFYDLKVKYRNFELYYHEYFYKAAYSPNAMKIYMRLRTVPTYALDWANIFAHIPWVSHSFPLHSIVRAFSPSVRNLNSTNGLDQISLVSRTKQHLNLAEGKAVGTHLNAP